MKVNIHWHPQCSNKSRTVTTHADPLCPMMKGHGWLQAVGPWQWQEGGGGATCQPDTGPLTQPAECRCSGLRFASLRLSVSQAHWQKQKALRSWKTRGVTWRPDVKGTVHPKFRVPCLTLTAVDSVHPDTGTWFANLKETEYRTWKKHFSSYIYLEKSAENLANNLKPLTRRVLRQVLRSRCLDQFQINQGIPFCRDEKLSCSACNLKQYPWYELLYLQGILLKSKINAGLCFHETSGGSLKSRHTRCLREAYQGSSHVVEGAVVYI